jgi:hypothetical protein
VGDAQTGIDLGRVNAWWESLGISAKVQAEKLLRQLALQPEVAPFRYKNGQGDTAYAVTMVLDGKHFRVRFVRDILMSRHLPSIIVTSAREVRR